MGTPAHCFHAMISARFLCSSASKQLAMRSAVSGSERLTVTVVTGNAASGGKRDDEDFVHLVTGMRLGFATPPTAEDLAKKCASTPQLVAHLSKMIQELVLPRLESVSLSATEPSSSSLHWPRRGGL